MSRKTEIFESKEWMSRERVADFLNELADKVRTNAVTLRSAANEVRVELPDELMLEVDYEEKRKDGSLERSLEIELEWREGGRPSRGISLG